MELVMFLRQLCRLGSLFLANGAARSEFLVSILQTTTLESFISSHSFSRLDLVASLLDFSLVDLPIFLKSFIQLDFLLFISDFVPADFLLSLHATTCLDFFSSSVGLAWVDFIFSLSVLTNTLSGVLMSSQSFAQLEAAVVILEAWIMEDGRGFLTWPMAKL